jgi:hypothetical protein
MSNQSREWKTIARDYTKKDLETGKPVSVDGLKKSDVDNYLTMTVVESIVDTLTKNQLVFALIQNRKGATPKPLEDMYQFALNRIMRLSPQDKLFVLHDATQSDVRSGLGVEPNDPLAVLRESTRGALAGVKNRVQILTESKALKVFTAVKPQRNSFLDIHAGAVGYAADQALRDVVKSRGNEVVTASVYTFKEVADVFRTNQFFKDTSLPQSLVELLAEEEKKNQQAQK